MPKRSHNEVTKDNAFRLRAALYARVSTDEQASEGFSIDAQLRVMREFCERKGWTVVGEYVDAGYSGRSVKRPKFQALTRDAHTHLFDVIVVHKLDRFSRSLKDIINELNELKDMGIAFASATQPIDLTTPEGKFMLMMLAVLAEIYIDNLSAETKKGLKERALKGYHVGSLAFGYQRTPKEQGGIPIPHETNVVGYRMAIQMAAEGHTAREIIRALNAGGYRTSGNWGNRPFSVDTILPILKSRFYLGEVYYKGEWLPGKHEPAIDADTWEQAQEQIKRRVYRPDKSKLTDRVYPMRQLLRCASCGRTLRGQNEHGDRRYRDPARDYGDNCPEPAYLKAVKLESQIGEFLSRVKLPEDWRTRMLERLNALDQTEQENAKKRTRLETQLQNTKRLFQLGDMLENEYMAERNRIQSEIAALRPSKLNDLEHAAELLSNFAVVWQRTTDAERLRLLHSILETVWVKGGIIVGIEPRAAMYELLKLAAEHDEGNPSDGNGAGGAPDDNASPVTSASEYFRAGYSKSSARSQVPKTETAK